MLQGEGKTRASVARGSAALAARLFTAGQRAVRPRKWIAVEPWFGRSPVRFEATRFFGGGRLSNRRGSPLGVRRLFAARGLCYFPNAYR